MADGSPKAEGGARGHRVSVSGAMRAALYYGRQDLRLTSVPEPEPAPREVRLRMAHPLPPGVSALQGALIEPLAIAWHTVNRCAVSAGQVVAIHGGGPIGAGAFLTLKRRGVEAIVVDPSPARRTALTALGARTVLDPSACDVVA